MNRYNRVVSEAEFNGAPKPKPEEVAIMAKAIGIAFVVGVNHLNSVDAIIEITPSARLRYVLSYVVQQIHGGKNLSESFATYGSVVGSAFMAAVRNGEIHGDLEVRLPRYADFQGLQPNKLADQIGRSVAARKFTEAMVKHMASAGVAYAIRDDIPNYDTDFQVVLTDMVRIVHKGCKLWEAFNAHPEVFDRLYREMILAAHKEGYSVCPFELLVTA